MPPRRRTTVSQRAPDSEAIEEDELQTVQSDHHDDDLQSEAPPASTFAARNENNHIRIMLATDNHVGYMERDPVRGQDSIRTFEEILQLAVQHEVDFILLGGDLFHENKPSRSTLHQTMALLRQYTLGDKPISVELLSDPHDGATPGQNFPAVNYEDPNLNVSIPVFSIHGNHDDPQGAGEAGALSALDLLSVSGLLNYFGKIELPSDDAAAAASSSRTAKGGAFQEKGIRIKPVLLQKGDTRVALYGMGNIKDERMHFELRANRVRMYRPQEDPDSWFNILCVHQNRVAHNPKACVPETMFDDSVHLVVWGHEHEQKVQPQPVTEKRYHITQPGSSVATSLSYGETVEKCVAIIHVEKTDFLIEPIPLQTVRPFVMDDMVLAEELEEAGLSSERGDIMKLLRKRVSELVDRAKREYKERHPDKEMPLPLIRLRVEYTNHEISNPQRFGQEFAGKVANPKDVLQFSKKKSFRNGRTGENGAASAYVDLDEADLLPMERLEKVDVGKLVQEYLQAQNLDILNSEGLEGAVLNFVEKDDKEAIDSFVTKMLRNTVKGLITIDPEESRIDGELERLRQEQQRRHDDADTNARGMFAVESSRPEQAGTRTRDGDDSDDSMMQELDVGRNAGEDDFDFEDDDARETASAPARRTAARSTATGASNAASRSKATNPRATAASTATGTPRRAAATRANQTFLGQSQMDVDDDDDGSDVGIDEDASTPAPPSTGNRHLAALNMFNKPAAEPRGKKTAAPARTPARTPARSATSNTRGRKSAAAPQQESIQISDDDDEDDGIQNGGGDDDDFVEPPSRGARKTARSSRTSRR